MTDVPPINGKSGWQPTVSTSAGALLGGAVAQVVTSTLEYYLHVSFTEATITAIVQICIFICGYCFPDGGRR